MTAITTCQVGVIIIPIAQMRSLRLRDTRSLASGTEVGSGRAGN